MSAQSETWSQVINLGDVPSPALLIYPQRVEENLELTCRIAGGPERLRPHIKTHKMAEVVRMKLARGITKFKCATIAEAEMAAGCGVPDLLMAYQPVGPNVRRLVELIRAFPQTRFSTIADDAEALRRMSASAVESGLRLEVLLDIDCGMHRSGIAPGPGAVELYRLMTTLPGIKAAGLHSYDGHIHDRDLLGRMTACQNGFAPVDTLREQLERAELPVPILVAGGTPTFPIHAQRANVECSPGTSVFWDFGYATKLPDMPFQPAALLLTRIVSKPAANRLCLDLGHKAVASENPHPRVSLLELPAARFVSHSEEHLVIETERAAEFAVGTALLGVPWHVCPTVALHSEAVVIRERRAEERWKVAARDRKLTI